MQAPAFVRQHKKLSFIIVLAVVVVLTGMILTHKSNAATYMTGKVVRGNITATVSATGSIGALTLAPVGSYVSGNVKYIFADFNTHVEAGQVLAQIDPASYEAQVITASGNLASAQANLQNLEANLQVMTAAVATNEANDQKAKANLEYVKVNARRTEDLYKQGVISHDQNDLTQSTLGQAEASSLAAESQVIQSKAQIKQTQAQIQQAKAQIEAARGNLQAAETNLSYTTIVSPINGVVVARNLDVGQGVASSLSASTFFTVAQDLSRMQVAAQVDESDTGHITPGTPCTFQVDAFPNETFHATVNSIRLNPSLVQNVVTYSVMLDFENPNDKLLPGETAYVTIPTGHASNAIIVPNSAMIFQPTSLSPQQLTALYRQYKIPPQAYLSHAQGWHVVWQLAANGKDLVPVAIREGLSDLLHTEIVAGNLKPGDTIVTGQLSGSAATGGNNQRRGPGGPMMIRR